ncbi:MAG TPA: hypothetical protein VI251_04535 [Pseudolabrys sp.]
MRRFSIVILTALVVVAPVLAGCSDFDPDKLDVFNLNEKKKLPGDRKDVFPGGVPGVAQGVPPEYMKGYQPPPDTASADTTQQPGPDNAAAGEQKKTAAAEPAAEPEPKAKAKPKPKPRTAARRPAQQPAAQPTADSQQQTAPWPEPAQQQPQPQQAQQSPWPAPAQQQATPAPWPSAPPPGGFSR